MTARLGRARMSTVLRDINALRAAIRAHDPEATEAAWERVERWIIAPQKPCPVCTPNIED